MTTKKEYNYLKIAFYCGLLPLIAGLGAYMLFRLELPFSGFMPMVGVFVIWFGLFLVLTGIGSVIIYLLGTGQTQGHRLGQRLVHALLVTALLLSNFPAAYFCATSTIDVIIEKTARYTLHITNQSGRAIKNLTITGPGVEDILGPLADGESIQRHFDFRGGDGSVSLKVTTSTTQSNTHIDRYITSKAKTSKTIRIRPDLELEVIDTSP